MLFIGITAKKLLVEPPFTFRLARGEAPIPYAKGGGLVGTHGLLEHVAVLFHPRFGGPMREACGGVQCTRTHARLSLRGHLPL